MNGMEMMFRQLLASSGINLNEQIERLENLGKLLAEIRDTGIRAEAKQNEILQLLKTREETPSIRIDGSPSTEEHQNGQ